MNIELDTHTHTLASGHAYSTITEMIDAAVDKGLKLLAITEHAPAMPGSCKDFYFYNLKIFISSIFFNSNSVFILLAWKDKMNIMISILGVSEHECLF